MTSFLLKSQSPDTVLLLLPTSLPCSLPPPAMPVTLSDAGAHTSDPRLLQVGTVHLPYPPRSVSERHGARGAASEWSEESQTNEKEKREEEGKEEEEKMGGGIRSISAEIKSKPLSLAFKSYGNLTLLPWPRTQEFVKPFPVGLF